MIKLKNSIGVDMTKGVYLTPSKLVILLFGGVRPLARLLDKTQSTVSKWQTTDDGGVPRKCHKPLLDLAKKRGIELTPEDLVFGRTIMPTKIAKMINENGVDKRISF